MSDWATWHLGDGILASQPLAEITARFAAAFEAASRPPAMAVFVRQQSGDLHCEVTVYFSPAAHELAQAFGATPCDPPQPDGLELLAGDPACRALLFPAP